MPQLQDPEHSALPADERVRPQTVDQDAPVESKRDDPSQSLTDTSTGSAAKKWIVLAVAAVVVIALLVAVFAFGGASGGNQGTGESEGNAANVVNANTAAALAAANANLNANVSASDTAAESSRTSATADNANADANANANTNTNTNTASADSTVTVSTENASGSSGTSSRISGGGKSGSGTYAAGGDADASHTDDSAGSGDSADNAIQVYVLVDSSRAPGYSATMANAWITLEEGATAYDAVVATGLAVGGNSTYVSSIGGLADKLSGYPGSGWIYQVNGYRPNFSCGKYVLSDGDEVAWIYTLDLGNDI